MDCCSLSTRTESSAIHRERTIRSRGDSRQFELARAVGRMHLKRANVDLET